MVAIRTEGVTLGLDAMRQLLLAGDADPLLPWWLEGLALVPYAILMMTVAHMLLARLERSAKRDGTLSVRWQ